MAAVRIPTPLRRFVDGSSVVEARGTTITEVLSDLSDRFPDVHDRLYQDGGLRPFINVFLNDEDIRFLNGEETPVRDGDRISIVPAIAGG